MPPTRPQRSDAARNRAALLAAAREVFERDGYVNSRIADIAATAGLAHGSFYSHFQSKEQALSAVLREVQDEMLHPDGPRSDDPIEAIEAANRAYLEAYRHNAKLMVVLEQVATIDPAFQRLRLERSQAFIDRNTKAIRQLQRDGRADPELDPKLTALALSTMVSRTAYVTLALAQGSVDLDHLTTTLTRLWTNALRISSGQRRRVS